MDAMPFAAWAGIIGATLVSEDLTSIGVGLAIRDGLLPLLPALLATFLGIYVGDVGLWAAGRYGGRRALRWRIVSRLPLATLERLGLWLDAHPAAAIIGSRFVPGTRLALYVAAGVWGRRPWRFIAWMAVAVALWTPFIVLSTYWLGPAVAAPLERWFGSSWLTRIATLLLLFAALRLGSLLATPAGRTRLSAGLGRWTHFEFWPAWLLNIPVALWMVWLAVRHRGPTVFSAANPGIEDGGIVGESKSAILERLPQAWVLPWITVPPGVLDERCAAVASAMAFRGWRYPMVLKPDVGERGVGVRWAQSDEDVKAYFAREPGTVVLQQAHEGPYEAGLFYVRHPSAERGFLFSVTDKRFPVVTGDGRSTLEQLIWQHPRFRLQARVFLARHPDAAQRVPAAGERVPLGRAGNHCQGTEFRNGAHLVTPELEAALDDIARQVRGFHFGRFDVRYACPDSFAAGRGFSIVELNGVTSEATHIYDPSATLVGAWRTLMRQWSLAFEIGAANRARGHAPISMRRLWTLLLAYMRRSPAHRISD